MRHVQIATKTYRDNSARSIDLPTILIEYNDDTQVLEQLHKYQLKNHTKSRTWHIKLLQAVGLLLDYMEVNQENYISAKDFFV